MAQKHGIVDDYFVMVNANGADPAGNVLLGEHYVGFEPMDPGKARDMRKRADVDGRLLQIG